MKKRIYAILLAIVAFAGVCLIGACGNKEEEKEVLTERAQTFVDAVNAIQVPITIESGSAIDAAYVAYSFLDEFDRDSKTVAAKKQTLDGYQTQYTALKGGSDDKTQSDDQEARIARFVEAVNALPAVNELIIGDRAAINAAYAIYNGLTAESKEKVASEYATLVKADNRVTALEEAKEQEEWQRAAEEFIGRVAEIGAVTLESGYELEDLFYKYENFPEGLKSIGGMAEAKAVLDEKYALYTVLRDAADVEEFVEAVQAIGNVTLDSESAIRKAENIYKYMSENAKADQSVVEAYATLSAARAAFDELFKVAEAERVQRFIEIANSVRTDIENVDISWYEVLDAAYDAYFSLDTKSWSLPEVEAAYERWYAAQTAFEQKGYKRIPNFSTNIIFSADFNIVMQLFEENTAVVRAFYNVGTNAELNKYAALYLDVYVNGEYVTKTELNMATLANGFIVNNVSTLLKGLAADNPEIVSGASFTFAVHIEDRNNGYIPTAKVKMNDSHNYTW